MTEGLTGLTLEVTGQKIPLTIHTPSTYFGPRLETPEGVIPVRKSLWLPLALAVLLILLIAGAQIGLRGHDVQLLVYDSLEVVVPFLWVPLGIAALVVWGRNREKAVGFLALAITSHGVVLLVNALAQLPGLTQLHLLRYLILPLEPVGLTLAVLAWAKKTPGRARQALLILMTAAAAGPYLYLINFSLQGPTQLTASILQLIQTVYWAAYVAVAWNGYLQESHMPLFWLAMQALWLGLHSLTSTVSLLLPMTGSNYSLPLYFVQTVLSLVATGGVLWSAARQPYPGR